MSRKKIYENQNKQRENICSRYLHRREREARENCLIFNQGVIIGKQEIFRRILIPKTRARDGGAMTKAKYVKVEEVSSYSFL